MENRQLITLGNRNKSISKLRQSSQIPLVQSQALDTSQHSRITTEPLLQSQNPFRMFHSPSAKQNTFSAMFPPHHHSVLGQSSVLRENNVLVSQQSFFNLSTNHSRVTDSKEKPRGNVMMESIKINSRQGSPITQVNSRSKIMTGEQQKNLLTLTLNQGTKQAQLLSKIKLLEQVISQKENENQQLHSIILQERNQNHRFNTRNQQLIKDSEENKARISELEEMLEREISKSLELMDQNESLSKEVDDVRAQILVKETLVKTLQEELELSHEKISSIETEFQKVRKNQKGQLQKLMDENESFKTKHKSTVNQLQTQLKTLENQLSAVNQSLHHKQFLFTELQTQYSTKLFTLENLVSQKQTQLARLNQTMLKQSLEIESLQSQIHITKSAPISSLYQVRSQFQQDKNAECKKCKELLQTVFRLNSHLNKK